MIPVLASGPRSVASGDGSVLHFSARAVNLLFGERVVTIMARHGTLAPSSVVLDVSELPSVSHCRFDGSSFISDVMSFDVGRTESMELDSGMALDVQDAISALARYIRPAERSIINALIMLLGGEVPPVHSPLELAVLEREHLMLRQSADCASAAASLLGAGFGLTPSGDDFACGVIAVLNTAHEDTSTLRRAVSGYSNAFSRTMLLDALDGLYAAPLLGLMRSVLGRGDLSRDAPRLLATGHTSGHDTLAGIMYALMRLSGEIWPPGIPHAPTLCHASGRARW